MTGNITANKKRKRTVIILGVLLGVMLPAWIFIYVNTQVTTLYPPKTTKPLVNPMVGFAPSADYYELANNDVLNSTLVYMDITWRELEPQKGTFNFDLIEEENYIDEWRALGKRVVFRFICDIPGKETHMDIPDWLYEETGKDGDWYDTDYGKGYSPNYNNETFISAHKVAIEALGARYGNSDFFSYIELGSLGHWGEWHTKTEDGIDRLPLEGVRDQYIQPYIENFPHAMLLMRRPFKAAKEHNMGIYNDMTGLAKDTEIWLNWINNGGEYDVTGEQDALVAMPDAWQTAPIGGEFTSAISMEQLLADDIQVTKDLIERSHMSFIGPKCPEGEALQYTHGIEEVRSLLGYSLRVEKAVLTKSPLYKGLNVSLSWINEGIAPFYKNWEVYLYLFDSDGKEVLKTQIDLALNTILDKDAAVVSETTIPISTLEEGVYDIGIAIIDPLTNKPGLSLAMENTRNDRIFLLGQWEKKK